MVQVIQVDFHLVGPNDGVIIGLWVGLLGKQFFFVAVFDAGGTCNAGTKLKDATVIALQLVGIAGHIRARSDEAHLTDEDVDQFGQAVHFAVAQPMAHARDAWIVGRGDTVAFGLVKHRAKLEDPEGLAVFSYAFLQEKHWTL